MTEVKWIKITTDMFDNKKIKQIRKMPGGADIILFWVMLLTLAGRSNCQGYILLTEALPYTAEMLANEFDIELNTVKLALDIFNKFDMINMEENVIVINGWAKYQNVEGMKEIKEREQARLRKRRQREKEKFIAAPIENCMSRDCHSDNGVNVTVNPLSLNNKEEDKELDKDKEDNINIVENSEQAPQIPFDDIVNTYNEICSGKLPEVRYITADRRKAIKTAWKRIKGADEEKFESFRDLFNAAANNSFLTGGNDRNWKADFNWLIKEKNMVKVLEGTYGSRTMTSGGGGKYGGSKQDNESSSSNDYDFSKYTG